jgi:hypothetical protein
MVANQIRVLSGPMRVEVLDAAQVGELNNFGAGANEGHIKISGSSPVRLTESNAGPYGGDIRLVTMHCTIIY